MPSRVLTIHGHVEFVEEFAGVVPVFALADLFGVPKDKHSYFRDLVLRAS